MTVEELAQRVADLEAKLAETPDERAAREEREWQAKRAAAARDGQIRFKRQRLADLDKDLAREEPWLDWLTRTRKVAEKDLATVKAALAADDGTDRLTRDVNEQRREVLRETLRVIDSGGWQEAGSDLYDRAATDGVSLNGHYGALAKTMRLVAALRTERENVQRELDALLAG